MTAENTYAWLYDQLAEVATAPRVEGLSRHDLLVHILAPLGPVEAAAYARAIEDAAWRVRSLDTARGGADHRMGEVIAEAAWLVVSAVRDMAPAVEMRRAA